MQNDLKKAAEKENKTKSEADIAFRKKQATLKKIQQQLKSNQNDTQMHQLEAVNDKTTIDPLVGSVASENPQQANTAPTPFSTKPKKPTEI